jgi:hypothetical protein
MNGGINQLRCRAMFVLGMTLLALSVFPRFSQAADLIRFLNSTEWGYQEVDDPAGIKSHDVIQRFEVRPGDCTVGKVSNDCERELERSEVAERLMPDTPLTGEQWYQWQVYFPEDYTNIYPARSIHGQFLDRGAKPVWTFEVGSTGVFWLGNRVAKEHHYSSLIDEDLLLGQWHEISVNVKWSAVDGYLRVWVNGEPRVDHQGPTCTDCRVFLTYGILRSELSRYRSRFKTDEIPVQVIYFTPARKSASGIGFSGYVPPPSEEQPESLSSDNETLEPEVTVELQTPPALPASDPMAVEKDRGEGEEEKQ